MNVKYVHPLTVKKLIACLRSKPQNALVGWRDHDCEEGEINNYVRIVSEDEVDNEKVVILSPAGPGGLSPIK
jgi:hypothetical protein